METVRIELKLKKELKEKAELKAKELNISLSAYIRMTLSKQ
jgi:antitoxin component of RelBE/YafQ-DinJ toxin-antitoxin module